MDPDYNSNRKQNCVECPRVVCQPCYTVQCCLNDNIQPVSDKREHIRDTRHETKTICALKIVCDGPHELRNLTQRATFHTLQICGHNLDGILNRCQSLSPCTRSLICERGVHLVLHGFKSPNYDIRRKFTLSTQFLKVTHGCTDKS